MSGADNFSISYTYGTANSLNDVIGRLAAMVQGSSTLSSFTYLGLSTVVEEDEPTMKLTYILQGPGYVGDAGDKYIGLDRFGRVIDQKWLENSTGSTLDDYQYAYDRDSNVVAKTNGVLGSFSETYTYSGLSQLTAVARGTNSQDFGVTSIGDITSITTNGTTLNHTVNSANQITAISGGTSLTYDANGNLLTDDQGEVLTYDGWNRLVSVASTTGTMIATYIYDGAGDLISQTEGGTTTDTYFSGAQDIETRTGVTATSSGTMATNTIYSPDYQNDVLARDSGGTRLYFTHDANYDVTAVISAAGAVDQRMAYDSYGKVSILTNGGSVTTDGYDLTHLWQGGLRDAVTGMYHFGARWYSTTLQQWVSMDPARAGMNWYESMADNPINLVDPLGTDAAAVANWKPEDWPKSRMAPGSPAWQEWERQQKFKRRIWNGSDKDCDCETISIFVDTPTEKDLGRRIANADFGHAGIAVGDLYRDIGSSKPWGSAAGFWWYQHPLNNGGTVQTTSDVKNNIAELGGSGNVYLYEVQVGKEEAKRVETALRALDTNLGTFTWYDRNCTTFVESALGDILPYRSIMPEGLKEILDRYLVNSCGSHRGEHVTPTKIL